MRRIPTLPTFFSQIAFDISRALCLRVISCHVFRKSRQLYAVVRIGSQLHVAMAAVRTIVAEPGDEIVDCDGAVLMPGLVNGHTHLYSALGGRDAGTAAAAAELSRDIAAYLVATRSSSYARKRRSQRANWCTGGIRCGTTTLIDHHASPNAIAGSLTALENGIAAVGCRGVLCYEVTDRNRPTEGQEGLAENERYARSVRDARGGQIRGDDRRPRKFYDDG